jgi:hypothetical protein
MSTAGHRRLLGRHRLAVRVQSAGGQALWFTIALPLIILTFASVLPLHIGIRRVALSRTGEVIGDLASWADL